MTGNSAKAHDKRPHDPLMGYASSVACLQQKMGKIAEDSRQTCGHLSRAAEALRSMSKGRLEARPRQSA